MIFRRSLVREMSGIATAAVAVLIGVLLTRVLIVLLGKAAAGTLAPEAVLALLGFNVLFYLPLILSIALFIAVLLALSRAHRDSEMTVWFASGISLGAWVRPVLSFAVPIAVVAGLLSLALSPWSQTQMMEYQRRLESRDDVSAVIPGMFRESRGSDKVFFVDKFSELSGAVNNVFVQHVQSGRLGVTVAERGEQRIDENGDKYLVLYNGRRYEGEPGSPEFRELAFERSEILIRPHVLRSTEPSLKSRSSWDLLLSGQREAYAELHWRIGMPIAALVVALLAIPLSFVNPRTGRGVNLIVAVLVYSLYYQLMSIFQAWVAQGKVSASVGLWPVHAGMILLVLLLFYRQLMGFRWLFFAVR